MKKSWRNNVEFYLIGLLVLTVAAFSITMPEIFWSISNFQSVASQMPDNHIDPRCWRALARR